MTRELCLGHDPVPRPDPLPVGRASRVASSFRRAKPSKLDPSATGTFDARAFFDPTERKWRIAARYVPAEDEASGVD